jgi:hypothetical protein
MTVKELRDALEGLDGDIPVILQKDAEGNGYSPLEGTEEGYYVATNTWSGEVFVDEADALECGTTPKPCVVLWPVN